MSILLGGVGDHPGESKKRPSALHFRYEHPRTAPLGSGGALGLEIFKNAKLVVVIFEAVKSPLASLTQILFGVIVGADAAFKVFPSNERLFPAVIWCFVFQKAGFHYHLENLHPF